MVNYSRQALKREVIGAYGGQCACCGERELEFLTIEHSRGDGASHRRFVSNIYSDLKRRGFPKGYGYTVLCWNCNMATRYGDPCPHEVLRNAITEPVLAPPDRLAPRLWQALAAVLTRTANLRPAARRVKLRTVYEEVLQRGAYTTPQALAARLRVTPFALTVFNRAGYAWLDLAELHERLQHAGIVPKMGENATDKGAGSAPMAGFVK